jgi:hypothetical protein
MTSEAEHEFIALWQQALTTAVETDRPPNVADWPQALWPGEGGVTDGE